MRNECLVQGLSVGCDFYSRNIDYVGLMESNLEWDEELKKNSKFDLANYM